MSYRIVKASAGGTAKHALLGTWRIVETDLWEVTVTDPAHLTLG